MYEFLESNKVIYNREFGFRTNVSTNYVLISMTESIKSSLDSGDFESEIFMDFEKVFVTNILTMDLEEILMNLLSLSLLVGINMFQ